MYYHMYRGKERIFNFILVTSDAAGVIISYFLAGYIWLLFYKDFSTQVVQNRLYDNFWVVMLAYALVTLFFNKHSSLLHRGKFEELKEVIKTNLLMSAATAMISLLHSSTDNVSRGVYVITAILYIIIMFGTHMIAKMYLRNIHKHGVNTTQILLVTTKDRAESVIKRINEKPQWMNRVASIAIVDENMTGQTIEGIKVVADFKSMVNYIKRQVVDEVFINIPGDQIKLLRDSIMEFENMGITVHINIETLEVLNDFDKKLNVLGDIPVITVATNIIDYEKFFVKRLMDIVLSVVGLLFTLVIMIIIAPAILIESRGPLFFKQKRVGKNGRIFNIYKFRSMYADAEERKQELLSKNEIEGLMFKITDDPRITKVGKFIRKTSLDEFPQFFNVMKGDMSIVGTRPPTLDEFYKYETYHKRRLSIKPGITGMWQISGRSNISNFEEVVQLDLKYIDSWNLWLDIKIILKTISVIFRKKGAK